MELIVGKKYDLKYTRQICNISNVKDYLDIKNISNFNPYIYVGSIDIKHIKDRKIFVSESMSNVYAMYGDGDPSLYAKPHTVKISIKDLADEYGVNPEEIEIVD